MAKRKLNPITKTGRVSYFAMNQNHYAEHWTDGRVTLVLAHDRTVKVYVGGTAQHHKLSHIDNARALFDSLKSFALEVGKVA